MLSGHQRITRHRNIAENFNRLSRVHERYRQTTDGRTTTYSEHEQEFTFAKNQLNQGQICALSRRLMNGFGASNLRELCRMYIAQQT